VIERGGLGPVGIVLTIAGVLSGASRLLCLMHLVVEFLQTRSDLRFCAVRVGIDTLAQPIRAALDQVGEVGLVHAAERVAQAGRCARLVRCEFAGSVAEVALQLLQVVRHLLAIVRQAVDGAGNITLAGRAGSQLPHLICLGILFF